MKIENRFLKYVSFDTQSDYHSQTCPSTMKQMDFGEFLVEEMRILGLKDVKLDEYGIVTGVIPSNNDHQGDVIGLIGHLDTSPDISGNNIQPQIIRNYDGHNIKLHDGKVISSDKFLELHDVIGHDIITSDGTTLLGGDGKAGITIIMSLAEYLYKHPEFKHNDIKIAFLSDTEIGNHLDHFYPQFQCDYVYYLNGKDINHIGVETFNASDIHVHIKGCPIHPGQAKNKLVNASKVAMEFHSMLNRILPPELSGGDEGFCYLKSMKGSVSHSDLEYQIRDFDLLKLSDNIEEFKHIQSYLNNKYHYDIVDLDIKKQYLNIKDIILQKPHIIQQVEVAMNEIGLQPERIAIRGGRYSSLLTFVHMYCVILGTGAFNSHSPYEFVSLTMMKKSVKLLLRLIKNNVNSHI